MRRLFLLLLPALLLLLPPLPEAAAEEPTEVLSFADALFGEGDFYRAITEYKRFLHLWPADAAAPRAALRIGESYLGGRRWDQADAALLSVIRSYPDSPEALEALRLHAESAFSQGDFPLARERYRRFLATAESEALRSRARLKIAWTLIEEGHLDLARAELSGLDTPEASALSTALTRLDHLPTKSPALAGGLSALLPGAGQLYVGRPRDSALAFLLNAAFIWGAVESFDRGNDVAGGILLFFEAGWYGGNVFNAVNHAHRINRDRREEAKKAIRPRFALLSSPAADGPLVGLSLRF